MKAHGYPLALFLSLTLINQIIGCAAYTYVNTAGWKAASSGGYDRVMLVDRRSFRLDPSRPVSLRRMTRVLTGTIAQDRQPVVLGVDSLIVEGSKAVQTAKLDETGGSSLRAVVVASGNTVDFSTSGGWYDPDDQVVIGTSESGEAIRLRAASIESALLEKRVTWMAETLKDTALRMRRVRTVSGTEYVFEGKGARYHDSVDVLAATRSDGRDIMIPVSEVQSLGKTDGSGTGLLIVAVLASLAVVGIIVQSEMNSMYDGIKLEVEN